MRMTRTRITLAATALSDNRHRAQNASGPRTTRRGPPTNGHGRTRRARAAMRMTVMMTETIRIAVGGRPVRRHRPGAAVMIGAAPSRPVATTGPAPTVRTWMTLAAALSGNRHRAQNASRPTTTRRGLPTNGHGRTRRAEATRRWATGSMAAAPCRTTVPARRYL